MPKGIEKNGKPHIKMNLNNFFEEVALKQYCYENGLVGSNMQESLRPGPDWCIGPFSSVNQRNAVLLYLQEKTQNLYKQPQENIRKENVNEV